jgi:hypothetical protein
MGDETTAKVWLYEAGDWKLADDLISWADGDDVMEKYAEAGYSEFGSPATWFLAFGLNSEDNPGYGAQVTLYVRDARPQCLIGIEGGTGSNRAVYAARFPDGLDLMARWVPVASTAALTAIALGLLHPAEDSPGPPHEKRASRDDRKAGGERRVTLQSPAPRLSGAQGTAMEARTTPAFCRPGIRRVH